MDVIGLTSNMDKVKTAVESMSFLEGVAKMAQDRDGKVIFSELDIMVEEAGATADLLLTPVRVLRTAGTTSTPLTRNAWVTPPSTIGSSSPTSTSSSIRPSSLASPGPLHGPFGRCPEHHLPMLVSHCASHAWVCVSLGGVGGELLVAGNVAPDPHHHFRWGCGPRAPSSSAVVVSTTHTFPSLS